MIGWNTSSALGRHSHRKTITTLLSVFGLSIGLALFTTACGNAAQKQAYEHAAASERQSPAKSTNAIISEYKEVVRLQPGSEWAKKAQARIDALEAQIKAEELHKSVFQEHGID